MNIFCSALQRATKIKDKKSRKADRIIGSQTVNHSTSIILKKMNTVLGLVLLISSSFAHPDYSDSWEEFKQTYEKEYETDMEEVSGYLVLHNTILIIVLGLQTTTVVDQSQVYCQSQCRGRQWRAQLQSGREPPGWHDWWWDHHRHERAHDEHDRGGGCGQRGHWPTAQGSSWSCGLERQGLLMLKEIFLLKFFS